MKIDLEKTHVKLVFALIIIAAFLDIVDFSIVQVALPTIRTEFGVSLADSQWIIGAYGLTLAGFLMLSGRAGDVYGQKKLFIFGVALFSIASLSGGLAPNLISLIVARGIQGLAAAISTVTALAIFAQVFPEGQERNKAFGFLVAVLSAGFAAGAITGGVLTAAFGWRSVLFVNVPIGIVAAVVSLKYLPNTGGQMTNRNLDLLGGLTVTSGTLLLVYALTNGSSHGFSSLLTVVPLVLSVLILLGFIFIEARSKNPLMPLPFLRRGTILTANVLGLIITAASGGLGFIITFYMQQILRYSALVTGLAFLPAAIIFLIVGGWGSPWFLRVLGFKRVLLLSMALVTSGNALLTQISVNGSFLAIEPGTIIWALGASIGFPALYIAALAGTKPGEEGLASGLITTSQRIGFPLGLAVLITVASLITPQTIGGSDVASAASLVLGFRYALFASALLALAGFLLALTIKGNKQTMDQPTVVPT